MSENRESSPINKTENQEKKDALKLHELVGLSVDDAEKYVLAMRENAPVLRTLGKLKTNGEVVTVANWQRFSGITSEQLRIYRLGREAIHRALIREYVNLMGYDPESDNYSTLQHTHQNQADKKIEALYKDLSPEERKILFEQIEFLEHLL